MKGTKKQIEELLKCISEGVYEKEHILSLSLLQERVYSCLALRGRQRVWWRGG